MIDWQAVDSVFLDMDGTLLDLHFDNHFWLEHVPVRFGELNGMSTDQAKDHLFPRFKAHEGTINWYCLDFWSDELKLDIVGLKREIEHLIQIHPHAVEFLDALRLAGKQVLLVTNAHRGSLGLKMEKTALQGHFDRLVSSHDYGVPKEDLRFWDRIREHVEYDSQRTLMVDDSLSVLRSARDYGIAWQLAISKPDSRQPVRDVEEFTAVEDFSAVMPVW